MASDTSDKPQQPPNGPRPLQASSVAETRAIMEDLYAPELLSLPDLDSEEAPRVLVLPPGLRVHSLKKLLDEYRQHPERRKGTAELTALDSLIDWTQRFKDDESALFC